MLYIRILRFHQYPLFFLFWRTTSMSHNLTLFSIFNMYPDKIKIRENGLNRLWGSNTLYEKLNRGATTVELLDY